MATEQPVLWQVADGVGTITLNRPDAANALNLAMAQGFGAAVDQALHADVGVVVIRAHGKQFCAGGDIRAFAAQPDGLPALVRDLLAVINPAIEALAAAPFPVVSALQGAVGGGGIGIALCADIVLASERMKLRGGYTAIALTPDVGASYFLSRRAGGTRAKILLLTNQPASAQECLQWGLVDEVCAADALDARVEALAHQLAHGARGAAASVKWLCQHAAEHDLASQLRLERDAMLRACGSADAREGIRAFVEKRAPRFAGEPGA